MTMSIALHPVRITVLGMLFSLNLTLANGPFLSITETGAIPNSEKIQTGEIQAAIDSCTKLGGGTVYFPPGEYVSGTVQLKDNIRLHLAAGALLKASQDTADYIRPLPNTHKSTLIHADSASGISITGQGIIDGQARHTYEPLEEVDHFIGEITENAERAGVEMKRYYIRPPNNFLVFFTDCENVNIEGVTLTNSSFWTLHLFRCNTVTVNRVKVYSSLERGVNADGIDITGCKNVTISDCIVETGDDGIVLKARGKPFTSCENVVVNNCIITSSSTALKLGTESYADFKNIVFSNCVVRNSNRGLSIVVRDGAHVRDVLFSNITIENRRRHFNWWGNADPIWVVLKKRRETSRLGSIERVVFENIVAVGEGTSRIESEFEGRLRDITLRGCSFTMQPESYADKRADDGLYFKNVTGLTLDNVSVDWDSSQAGWESAIEFEAVSEIWASRIKIAAHPGQGEQPLIALNGVQNANFSEIFATTPAEHLFELVGQSRPPITVQTIDPWERAKYKFTVADSLLQVYPNLKALIH